MLQAAETAPQAPSDSDIRVIRSGFSQHPGYQQIDETGRKSGYGYEFLQEIAKYADFKFVFSGSDETWNKNIQRVENGEIDILPFISADSREKYKYLLTKESIASFPVNMYVRRNDIRFSSENYPYVNNMKIGMTNIDIIHNAVKTFAEQKNFTWQSVLFKTTDEAVKALLESGTIDAFVSTVMPTNDNQRMLTAVARTDFYIAVSPDQKELADELDRLIKKVLLYNPGIKTQLYAKYFGPPSGTVFHLDSLEEKFIEDSEKKRRSFTVLMRPDYYPLSSIKNGIPAGIAAEILNTLSRRTNLTFTVIKTQNTAEYDKLAAAGTADIIIDGRTEYNWAERNGYKLTSPYLSMNICSLILSKPNRSAEKTAVPSVGGRHEKELKKAYAYSEIVYYGTPADCTAAVIDGEAKSAVLDSFTAAYYLNNDPYARFTEAETLNLQSSMSLAVNEKAPLQLLSILNKAVLGLDQNTIHEIILRQTSSNESERSTVWLLYRYPGRFISFFFLFGIALTVIIVFAVKDRERRKRLAVLVDSAQFGSIVCQIFDDVSEWNLTADTNMHIAFVNDRVILHITNSGSLNL